jgi:cobaltochelatase CobN
MKPGKITFIAVGSAGLNRVQEVINKWEQGPWPGRLQVDLFYVGQDEIDPSSWSLIIHSLQGSDFLFIDSMGVPKDLNDSLANHIRSFEGEIAVVNTDRVSLRFMTRLGKFSMAGMSRMGKRGAGSPSPERNNMLKMIQMMEKVGKAFPVGRLRDMRNFLWLWKYWLLPNEANIENMLFLIGREYFGWRDFPKPDPPQTRDELCLMDPGTGVRYSTAEEFWRRTGFDEHKGRVALLYSLYNYPVDCFPVVSKLQERLREQFNILPIALSFIEGSDLERVRQILMPNGEPAVDLVANLVAFRLGQGPMGGAVEPALDFMKELNVPVLHPFLISKRTIQDWEDDPEGVKTGEFLLHYFLPEQDGNIEHYPVAAIDENGSRFAEFGLIEERVDHLAKRISNWIQLRKKPNDQKKIALILYDYPPGEDSVGRSAFLDAFASLEAILDRLAQEGYSVPALNAKDLHEIFIEDGRLNTPVWHADMPEDVTIVDRTAYRRYIDQIPGALAINDRWGEFPGEIMVNGNGVVLPAVIRENTFIGLQPSRGGFERERESYHDKNILPHHQYLAFYRWLEEDFGVDVCLHIGTHGTLEFLPGKEKALSGDCFPDILLGSMPHLYLYYCGNPSEAMLAKRRAHATVISHMPPPFVQGELYGEMETMQLLLNEYEEAHHLDPTREEEILKDLHQSVDQMGWTWKGIDDIEERLYEMRTASIPSRLHTIGQAFSDQEAREFLRQYFQANSVDGEHLYQHLASEQGWDWEEISSAPVNYQARKNTLEKAAEEWIQHWINDDEPGESASIRQESWMDPLLITGKTIYQTLTRNQELDALCRSLEGEYLPAGMGGDLFRNPDILPTGRNMYQFDPQRVPSPSAVRMGKRFAENTLDAYQEANGEYPRSVAVVLWGLETSQTQGETVGQVLAYLGVRRMGSLWDPKLELITLEELGRPRVDVTLQICGFFRDMFPNLITLIQGAFQLVAESGEPPEENFILLNRTALKEELIRRGMKAAEADEYSLARIFGPAPAEYGTSLTTLIKRKDWTEEGDIVASYLSSLQYVYSPSHHGVEARMVLDVNLSRVDLVSQVRSTRDYEMTDLDHYYEFYGGLAKSVEQTSGKKAMLLVSDSTEGQVRTETMAHAVQRGIRTRLLNPSWLDGMLKHSYHGGQELAGRLENLVGLAATTGEVDNQLFDDVNDKLALDGTMRERIKNNNPYALREIMGRLLEAEARGYWEPSPEKLEELQKHYLALEGYLEAEE